MYMLQLILIATCLFASVTPYLLDEDVLQSPQKLLGLYSSFSNEFPRSIGSSAEQRLRVGLFKKSVKFVIDQNARQSWRSGLNMFSDMTIEEARRYEGVNMTGLLAEDTAPSTSTQSGDYKYPEEAHWLESVFEPMDQGNCGSCWIFGSLTAFEGRYHQLTGRLKRFSQQQMLDCVFAWRDEGGCAGGANYCTYNYIKAGHPLITSKDYPQYVHTEQTCREDRYSDGQQAGKLVGWINTHPSEEGLLVALSQGVVGVSFESTAGFRAYESGVIRDETCSGAWTTHAVAAVGYTSAYILIKNSWGTHWGEQGFVKFGRNHHGCLLHTKPIYPILEKTGRRDSDAQETPTSYRPKAEDTLPKPSCKDKYPSWFCKSSVCSNYKNAVDCMRTCKRCSFDVDTCPAGDMMCKDATCKGAC